MAERNGGVIVLPGNMNGVPAVKNLGQLVKNFPHDDIIVFSPFTEQWRMLDREHPMEPGIILDGVDRFQDCPVLLWGSHGPSALWRSFPYGSILNMAEHHYDSVGLLSHYFSSRMLPSQRIVVNLLGMDRRSHDQMIAPGGEGIWKMENRFTAQVNNRVANGASYPFLLAPYNGSDYPDEYSEECVPIENAWELRAWMREQLSSFATARINWVAMERLPMEPGRMRAWMTFPMNNHEPVKLHCLEESPEDPYEGEIDGCMDFLLAGVAGLRTYANEGESMALDLGRLNVDGPRGMRRGNWVLTAAHPISRAEGVGGLAPRHLGWDE